MKLRRILIVPSDLLVGALYRRTRALLGKNKPYNGELQFYADIPTILGRENTFCYGRLYQHFFSSHIPDMCPYPSCHNTPHPTFISQTQLKSTLRFVDAVLVSSNATLRGRQAIRLARSTDTPIAIFDFLDHETLYGQPPEFIRRHLTRGFKPKQDFDLFIKKDLLLGFSTDIVIPAAPVPVRPESYNMPAVKKSCSVFYSGRKRIGKVQPERSQVVNMVRKHIPGHCLIEHESRSSFLTLPQYFNHLSSAQCALSPSGRVWDSFRHCEVGLALQTALLAPKPYLATVGPPLKDDVNSILYQTKLIKNKYYLDDRATISRVKYYLSHPNKLRLITNTWHKDVISGHTIRARSQYFINQINKIL